MAEAATARDWRYHPQRDALLAEAHARPFTPLTGPALVTRLATLSGPEGETIDRDHMIRLSRKLGQPEPSDGARWCVVDGGGWRLRWERHTELSTWTFFRTPSGNLPFEETALDLAPADWVRDLPGEVLVATRLEIWPAVDEKATAALFGVEAVGASLADGAAIALTDFRPDAGGMTRFLLLAHAGDAAQTGRLVQSLLEIETYRMMALLAFPVAGKTGAELTKIERKAVDLAHRLVQASDPDGDRALLDQLALLAGETEALIGRTAFRFDAAAAYHRIVRERIGMLREDHLKGLLTLGEFMQRRLDPAMRTCDAVAERQRAAIGRIARMTQMLNTRVEVATEATNAALLASMDRRAATSLKLQQAVEGLSTVAIAYYAAGLLGFPLKAAEHVFPRFDAVLAQGIAAPVIALGVFLGLWLWRRRMEREH